MGEVAARAGDVVVITSDNPRSEVPEDIIREIEPGVRSGGLSPIPGEKPGAGEKGYRIESDRRKAIEWALAGAEPGDMIFIGGKGHETYQIVGGEVHPFDDRLVVREYYEKVGEMTP
jgi:UDP-N-acetylmuramoyl-L-alanyl-D-glutamate--2,6-diaminopimelate ligase